MVSDAPIMFLWIFSAVISVGCRVTLLYYCLTPGQQKPFHLSSTLALITCFSSSLSPSLHVPFSVRFFLCISALFPRWLLLKRPWDWPEWFLRSDGKNVWEMRWWTKGSCRGPFQHVGQLCYLGQKLCRRTGATRRIGQGKAINTLWNWSRKFRKCCKGKQHCIMYLLTFPCIAWLAKDDQMKCFGVPFCYWFHPLFPFGHKPLAVQFGMEQQFIIFSVLFVGDKFLCSMRHTWVFCRKMRCSPLKDTGKHGPCSRLSNYRPGTEECQSERQMVQGCCLLLTSSFPSLSPFTSSLKPGPAIFHEMTAMIDCWYTVSNYWIFTLKWCFTSFLSLVKLIVKTVKTLSSSCVYF